MDGHRQRLADIEAPRARIRPNLQLDEGAGGIARAGPLRDRSGRLRRSGPSSGAADEDQRAREYNRDSSDVRHGVTSPWQACRRCCWIADGGRRRWANGGAHSTTNRVAGPPRRESAHRDRASRPRRSWPAGWPGWPETTPGPCGEVFCPWAAAGSGEGPWCCVSFRSAPVPVCSAEPWFIRSLGGSPRCGWPFSAPFWPS